MDGDELLALIDERIHRWSARNPNGDCSRLEIDAVLGELRDLRDQLNGEGNYLMTRSGAYGAVIK